MKRAAAFAFALLIGTTSSVGTAHAEDDAAILDTGTDAASTGDAVPGPQLPNGEPLPPPDLVSDTGGCSCRAVGAVSAPFPFVLLPLALATRLRRQRRSARERKPRA